MVAVGVAPFSWPYRLSRSVAQLPLATSKSCICPSTFPKPEIEAARLEPTFPVRCVRWGTPELVIAPAVVKSTKLATVPNVGVVCPNATPGVKNNVIPVKILSSLLFIFVNLR